MATTANGNSAMTPIAVATVRAAIAPRFNPRRTYLRGVGFAGVTGT